MPTKQTKLTRESLAKLAIVTLSIDPETIPFEGNASAIGPDEDAATNAWIREQLARGNEWAWCVATVTAEYDGCTGRASLGGCSYEGRKAFDDAGETAQLASEALDDLWAQLEARTPAGASVPSALRWAATAVAGEYLVKYEDTGLTDSEDPGSRCGYGDDELDAIRRELGKRDLTLAADDCGLVAQEER